MGLVALDEAMARSSAAKGPIETCISDRVVLATLYAIAGRDRASFYGFWQQLRRPVGPHTGDDTYRGNSLHAHFAGICRALGVKQTIAFGIALSEARNKPRDGFRTRQSCIVDDERSRFAEFLRETMNEQRDADRERRARRECGLRG